MLFLIFAPLFAKAQDPSFSQFYFNQLYYNPAFAGLSGGATASITHRILWPNLPGKFTTSKFSADLDMSNSPALGGIGIIAVTDIAGQGFLKTNTISIPVSVRLRDIEGKHIFQFGIKTSIIMKSVNWDRFVFSDQFDPVNGIVRPSDFSASAQSSITFPDFGAGVVYEYRNALYEGFPMKKWSIRIGAAAHHIFQPDYSFLGVTSKLPIKYVLHASGEFPLINNSGLIIAPAIIIERQPMRLGLKTLNIGTNALWRNFFMGGWFRTGNNVDALSFVAGLKFGSAARSYLSYSRDYTISKLMSGTGGSHEINLSYRVDEEFLYDIGFRTKRVHKAKMVPCTEF